VITPEATERYHALEDAADLTETEQMKSKDLVSYDWIFAKRVMAVVNSPAQDPRCTTAPISGAGLTHFVHRIRAVGC